MRPAEYPVVAAPGTWTDSPACGSELIGRAHPGRPIIKDDIVFSILRWERHCSARAARNTHSNSRSAQTTDTTTGRDASMFSLTCHTQPVIVL